MSDIANDHDDDMITLGGPPVIPFKQRVYTEEQVRARTEGLKGKAIFDEYAKIEAEENAILAARAKKKSATKAAGEDDDSSFTTPEDLPPLADDPHGMAFTDEEIAALTATDNEATKALAFATATPAKQALLRAKSQEK